MKKSAWILFLYTLLVILWGAWVRISHSGDGCGDSWPLCQGQVIPTDGPPAKTWVEYIHRLMSGIYGIYVFALWYFVIKHLKAPHAGRTAAHAVLFFTITEALLGAKLVIFGLVTENASWARTLAMSLHQLNSLLLTGSVALLILALTHSQFRWRPRAAFTALLFVLIAVTGAWAALAGTLFPSESLWEGLTKDFSPDSHHLLRLRVLHPLIALLGGGGLAAVLWYKSFEDSADSRLHRETSVALIAALLFGALTLLLLSPVWMKLAHLAMAHVLWALLIRWAFTPTIRSPQ